MTALAEYTASRHHAAWGAICSMALGVVVLIASEFMPVSLLTPVAQDLGISQGQAGQAISVSGFFAVLTSLLNTPLTGRYDRKKVLIAFTLLLTISGLAVTFAPDGLIFIVGRALLGVAIGGFWSMSTATIMRLAPPHAVAKGLALINGGNALAATIAAPLGSFLGQYIGWRGAFLSSCRWPSPRLSGNGARFRRCRRRAITSAPVRCVCWACRTSRREWRRSWRCLWGSSRFSPICGPLWSR